MIYSLSKIKNLYSYEDGDTLTPHMGVQIDVGYGLQQFYDATTKEVTQTNFADHPVVLFPQVWSSRTGSVVVPSTTGQQWYYGNPSNADSGILDSNGNVKSAFTSLFEKCTVSIAYDSESLTFPGLRIKGNLIGPDSDDFSNRYIYYRSTYDGKEFTCCQEIPVQSVSGEAYGILVSCQGQNGVSGDDVLSSDNDYVEYTAFFQLAGQNIGGATLTWEHLEGKSWVTVVHTAGLMELSDVTVSGVTGKKLKLYDHAVEGTEVFRAKAVFTNGKKYYATVQPTDVHDLYYIEENCSIVGDTIKDSETATFTPKVYDRTSGADVTASMGWTFEYTYLKKSDRSVISGVTGNSITGAKVKEVGGVLVRIHASSNAA